MAVKNKELHTVCLKCGEKYGNNLKQGSIGMWEATCDICGKKTYCADAKHDFGIGISKKEFEISNSI